MSGTAPFGAAMTTPLLLTGCARTGDSTGDHVGDAVKLVPDSGGCEADPATGTHEVPVRVTGRRILSNGPSPTVQPTLSTIVVSGVMVMACSSKHCLVLLHVLAVLLSPSQRTGHPIVALPRSPISDQTTRLGPPMQRPP